MFGTTVSEKPATKHRTISRHKLSFGTRAGDVVCLKGKNLSASSSGHCPARTLRSRSQAAMRGGDEHPE